MCTRGHSSAFHVTEGAISTVTIESTVPTARVGQLTLLPATPRRLPGCHPNPMSSLLLLQALAPAMTVPRHHFLISPLRLASAATVPFARRLSNAASSHKPESLLSEPVNPSPSPSVA